MNKDNFNRVLNRLKNTPAKRISMSIFCSGNDMSSLLIKDNECGTAGCIAGYTVAELCSKEEIRTLMITEIATKAMILLGITENQRKVLFYPEYWNRDKFDPYTKKGVIERMEHMLRTGK